MKRNQVVLDVEIYSNFFMLCFKQVLEGGTKTYMLYEGSEPLNVKEIRYILDNYETISFNGLKFDLPLITMALNGYSVESIKAACNSIIVDNKWVSEIEKQFDFKTIRCKHIDLMEIAVGDCSLKIYGGRLNSKRMQDLPIAPEQEILPEQREELRLYCLNDLDTTIDLFKALEGQLSIREQMEKTYGMNLMSLSEGQIAEAVIKRSVESTTGKKIRKNKPTSDRSLTYTPAPWIKFQTPECNRIFEIFKEAEFISHPNGKIELPPEAENLSVTLGECILNFGIGGIHSAEEHISRFSDSEHSLIDADFASLYPTLMVLLGVSPPAYGDDFFDVFKDILHTRLAAKKAGDKVKANSLKLLLNSSYGRLGSIYSTFYDPQGMLAVTITGQLTLLQLMEKFHQHGIPIVSANTDGVVCLVPKNKEEHYYAIVKSFEQHTGLEMEFTHYKSIHNSSVNTYFAIQDNGKMKLKGLYSEPGLQKNPQNYVCSIAVQEYLKTGADLEETIKNHKTFTDFLTVRRVTGGGYGQDGTFLGKAVRWYLSTEVSGAITNTKGNVVATSTGGKPCMTLPDVFPYDINYEAYLRIAKKILIDIGMVAKPAKLPRKNSSPWKELRDSGKIIEYEGVWEWVE